MLWSHPGWGCVRRRRGGERIGQGRENARLFLKEHPEMAGDLAKKILAKRGIVAAGEAATEGA